MAEMDSNQSKYHLGYKAIENMSPVELWRLRHRLTRVVGSALDLNKDTNIAIRTRYRPHKKLQIHTLMVEAYTQSK